jgi:hypothetical protein
MTHAHLSQDATRLLEDAGCAEVTDDHIVIGELLNVRIPLSRRTIAELNRQAFARWVDLGQPAAGQRRRPSLDETSSHEAAAPASNGSAAHVAEEPPNVALSSAVRAVNERRRQVELRRIQANLSEMKTSANNWNVTLPRATVDALESERRNAAALRRLFDSGPVMPLAIEAQAPHRLRDVPLSLAHTSGRCLDPGLRGQPLAQLFDAEDAHRVQQALREGSDQLLTLSVQLLCTDGRAVPCRMHIAPRDALEPDLRWVCLIEEPALDAEVASSSRHHTRDALSHSMMPFESYNGDGLRDPLPQH